MKNTLYLLLLLILALGCAPKKGETTKLANEKIQHYDSLLAVETGADEYGMRKYVIAFLKAGPIRSQSKAEADSLQRLHLNNIRAMAESGKLVLAGPFLDDGDIRGIYVFAVNSVEEAEALTATDPSVMAGRLIMELKPWYGSAAVMKINELHKQVAKISF